VKGSEEAFNRRDLDAVLEFYEERATVVLE